MIQQVNDIQTDHRKVVSIFNITIIQCQHILQLEPEQAAK